MNLVELIKKELKDMKATVFKLQKESEPHEFSITFALGYLRAIDDTERFIHQVEYLQKIKEMYDGKQG